MNHYLKQSLWGVLIGGLTGLGMSTPLLAQSDKTTQEDPALKIYRAAATKVNDLVHTKLDVRFDYAKRYLYGKAWITLKPHFYTTDSLTLDAKGMDIKTVAIVKDGKNIPLKYTYDQQQLQIRLDKSYTAATQYVVFIEYTAKPNELTVKGSAAITDAKGLYFINPDGTEPNKPTQIWTQGETEASSVWFPTIDRTNQKCTQEISMTVQKKYVTLSNGKLVSQKNNADGTRTDTWKMDLPHSPYLFMMAVGEYAVVKDSWRGKEVSYYLEKPYEKYAKQIFGNTPEMLTFFSQLLGYEYPWVKYAQVTGRDYVSGAMENTTATLHGEFMQKTDRELLDNNNYNETVIAHELYHHWFGDLATSESWSNLTVNESSANYSEYLWLEHKYGKDAADENGYEAGVNYLTSLRYSGDKDLVRFHYHDKEDMFDAITYQKGGRILHMLRNIIGDSAFFKSLQVYLKTNAFKATEAHHLRLAFEEVTGQDLNWFFNQWYFGKGFPELDISYKYNETAKTVTVILQQIQRDPKVWQLPMAVDIYEGGKATRHQLTMHNRIDSFTYSYTVKPDLVNVDADKVLLAKMDDHRDFSSYFYQYTHAPLYMDRRDAIEEAIQRQGNDPQAIKLLQLALKDKYHGLRSMVAGKLKLKNSAVKAATIGILTEIAKQDPHALVRAAALENLAELKDPQYKALFVNATKDKSYGVEAAGLSGLATLDADSAYIIAKKLESDAKGKLVSAIVGVYAQKGNAADTGFVSTRFEETSGQDKLNAAFEYLGFLSKVNNTPAVVKGLGQIKGMTDQFKSNQVNTYISNWLDEISRKKSDDAAVVTGTPREELLKQADYMRKASEALKAKIKE
ncbi:M1 family aminopeptidase [Chitinophaga nivalis]|uniref:Aminopeptidase N n=1 Tax=Chitinophaga nivalis TaxID=2991709 RepID=A0ABT3IX05_9BACT|nr:M1 family aminopeptidase [Chitinophaga nivalis]MCW3461808.1 M1 family aminopeptidase [Chitinophaga nivalis]MCW3488498.1 M1 family aminopeptidase [Chitinophaga nivalis]